MANPPTLNNDAPVTVLPVVTTGTERIPEVGTEEYALLNQRRAELVRKKFGAGLTPLESLELERLQAVVHAAVARRTSATLVSDADLDALEARLAAEHEAEKK